MENVVPLCPIYFRPFVGVPCHSIYNDRRDPLCVLLVQIENLMWVTCLRVVAKFCSSTMYLLYMGCTVVPTIYGPYICCCVFLFIGDEILPSYMGIIIVQR